MTQLEDAQADEQLALHQLRGLSLLCTATDADANAAVMAIPEDARNRAAVAIHVREHGEASVGEALRAGRLVSHEHLLAVHAAVQKGGDPIQAAGADPEHVALLDAAAASHEPHRERLEAAYAEYSAKSRAAAGYQPPSSEPPGVVGPGVPVGAV